MVVVAILPANDEDQGLLAEEGIGQEGLTSKTSELGLPLL
jgi:hypothetical protein